MVEGDKREKEGRGYLALCLFLLASYFTNHEPKTNPNKPSATQAILFLVFPAFSLVYKPPKTV